MTGLELLFIGLLVFTLISGCVCILGGNERDRQDEALITAAMAVEEIWEAQQRIRYKRWAPSIPDRHFQADADFRTTIPSRHFRIPAPESPLGTPEFPFAATYQEALRQ